MGQQSVSQSESSTHPPSVSAPVQCGMCSRLQSSASLHIPKSSSSQWVESLAVRYLQRPAKDTTEIISIFEVNIEKWLTMTMTMTTCGMEKSLLM